MMYDVVVAGLGGMGSAAIAHCASRGARVLGLEQFARGHALGASAGKSRVIRRAYFEGRAYVPLLDRAYALWRELDADWPQRILYDTGLITIGYRGCEVLERAAEAARSAGVLHEVIAAEEIRRRYPALSVRDDEYAVFEPEGGFIVPESATAAHLRLAERHGAVLRFETSVRGWQSAREGLRIDLADGNSIAASRLILTLGPWFDRIFGQLGVPIRVQRNVMAWFRPRHALGLGELPVFLLYRREFPAQAYGFPDVGHGVKIGLHGFGPDTQAGALDRAIDAERDVAPLAAAFESWAPGAAQTFIEGKACMYTLTPDGHFVVDRHPEDARVVLCGGFSGHGFKFASVIGEIAAGLALRGESGHDLAFLSLRRFL